MIDSTTSAQLSEILSNLKYLKYLNSPLYFDPNFLSALITSIVALLIALFNEPIRKIWRITNLEVKSVRENEQNNQTIYYRLVAKNTGNTTIRDAEIYIEKVIDDYTERKNFLPVPLRWTHSSAYMTAGVYRNIHPGQTVLLDFCEYIADKKLVKLFLSAGGEVNDYSIIKASRTKLFLNIYQESGQTSKAEVLIKWNKNKKPVVSIIK